MKGIIISGFAGIGKTTVEKKYPGRVIDMESSDFKWIYGDVQTENMLKEARKGVLNKRVNPEWPANYVEAIKNVAENFDVILISQQDDVRALLDENQIEYLLVFPSIECKEEYLSRYISRGNQQAFVKLIKANFEKWIQDLMQCPGRKFIMRPGQHLEDVLKENKII